MSAAVAYSELLRPNWAFASHECTSEFYDAHGFYGDCTDHQPTTSTPPPTVTQPGPAPDTTRPTTQMKVSHLSLVTLLLTRTLVLNFRCSEAATVTFTVSATVANGSGAEAARRVVVARATKKFSAPGKKRIRLKLTRKGRKLLAKRRRATLRVSARAVDAAGNARTSSVLLKLH